MSRGHDALPILCPRDILHRGIRTTPIAVECIQGLLEAHWYLSESSGRIRSNASIDLRLAHRHTGAMAHLHMTHSRTCAPAHWCTDAHAHRRTGAHTLTKTRNAESCVSWLKIVYPELCSTNLNTSDTMRATRKPEMPKKGSGPSAVRGAI